METTSKKKLITMDGLLLLCMVLSACCVALYKICGPYAMAGHVLLVVTYMTFFVGLVYIYLTREDATKETLHALKQIGKTIGLIIFLIFLGAMLYMLYVVFDGLSYDLGL